jgi:hypothetical protein
MPKESAHVRNRTRVEYELEVVGQGDVRRRREISEDVGECHKARRTCKKPCLQPRNYGGTPPKFTRLATLVPSTTDVAGSFN